MSLSLQQWKLDAICALPPDAWWWTRRPKKDGEELHDAAVYIRLRKWIDVGRVKWEVGRSLALVPGRGQKQVAWATPAVIRLERLQDITEEQAELELVDFWAYQRDIDIDDGYSSRKAFALLWNEIYTDRPALQWAANPEVWALGFRRADTVFEGEAK